MSSRILKRFFMDFSPRFYTKFVGKQRSGCNIQTFKHILWRGIFPSSQNFNFVSTIRLPSGFRKMALQQLRDMLKLCVIGCITVLSGPKDHGDSETFRYIPSVRTQDQRRTHWMNKVENWRTRKT